jgi:hypothetical protein
VTLLLVMRHREPEMTEAVEIFPVPDIYADGIAEVELLGENIRLTFFTWRNGEKIIVARMVRPRSSFLAIDHIEAILEAKRVAATEGLQ